MIRINNSDAPSVVEYFSMAAHPSVDAVREAQACIDAYVGAIGALEAHMRNVPSIPGRDLAALSEKLSRFGDSGARYGAEMHAQLSEFREYVAKQRELEDEWVRYYKQGDFEDKPSMHPEDAPKPTLGRGAAGAWKEYEPARSAALGALEVVVAECSALDEWEAKRARLTEEIAEAKRKMQEANNRILRSVRQEISEADSVRNNPTKVW